MDYDFEIFHDDGKKDPCTNSIMYALHSFTSYNHSLADAGYPGAASLGDAVCGMAVAYITEKDFLFWFRSHTAKEIKWGGAKHHPEDKDDGQRMHPRSSFKAFLEVVKSRSLPWENAEMDAIHSLQLILRDSFKDAEHSNSKAVLDPRMSELELQGVVSTS